jgi:transcriptional regulator with PAS, ATPase and Fis domain
MVTLHFNVSGMTNKVSFEEEFTFGKDPSNSYSINHRGLADFHFPIKRVRTKYIFKDLHSRRGIKVNGTQVMEAVLSDQDHIQLTSDLSARIDFHLVSEPKTSTMRSLNEKWQEQLQSLPHAAKSDLPILLLGESGTGKELLTQEIHQQSHRKKGPLVSINCSALSESLIESELFGHLRGSFTGATINRKGAFETANGGTLFLDEIGDLPLSLQPKLLRALENQEIRPVGSDQVLTTNVRIIAATHQKLADLVRKNLFRQDLFYRLNVIQLNPPPLRRRMEDLETLTYQFAKQYRVRFAHESIQLMKEYHWPGNIRELKNFVAKISAIYPQTYITKEQIHSALFPNTTKAFGKKPKVGSKIQKVERRMIIEKLLSNYGNQRKTAAALGIPKSTLHDRIQSYNIDVQQLLDG